MTEEIKEEKIEIELGALLSAPVWEPHKRGKNWCATVCKDPTGAGGIGRSFHTKAGGEYYYLTEGIEAGDVLEFGADYYTSAGRKRSNREFLFVQSIDEKELVYLNFGGKKATAFKHQKSQEPKSELDILKDRKKKLQDEIKEINLRIKEIG